MIQSADMNPPNLAIPAKKSVNGHNGYKIVSIRLRSAEFEALREQSKALGLTNNLALRIAARKVGGFLEVDQITREKLENILTSIGEISATIRHLHMNYASSGDVDFESLQQQRIAFGEEFSNLDALLRSILNVSQRRTDGRRVLAEAMT